MNTQRIRKNLKYDYQEGQSSIEFLITIIFVVSIIFSFVKLAINMTNGYLAHYATFMASRTYMVIDNNSNTPAGSDNYAEKRASEVFNSYKLSTFVGNYKGALTFNAPDFSGKHIYVGALHSFSQAFSINDFVGGKSPIEFLSESFLGREPTIATCFSRVCYAMKEAGGDCQLHTTIFDNGC